MGSGSSVQANQAEETPWSKTDRKPSDPLKVSEGSRFSREKYRTPRQIPLGGSSMLYGGGGGGGVGQRLGSRLNSTDTTVIFDGRTTSCPNVPNGWDDSRKKSPNHPKGYRSESQPNEGQLKASDSPSFVDDVNSIDENLVPTVFRWGHGGNSVFVSGTFNDWEELLPMYQDGNEFMLIYNVAPGVHQYKFKVDGKWRYSPEQSTAYDPMGNLNNTMEVKKHNDMSEYESKDSPPSSYGTLFPQELVSPGPLTKEPPILPPHLLNPILNAQETPDEPVLLPLPNHVILNRVYSLDSAGKDTNPNLIVLGSTHRYKTKFVSAIFYTEKSPS